jgi:tetratricopeptide (TPR) repeat protein
VRWWWVLLARAGAGVGRPRAALGCYHRALASAPDDANLHAAIGFTLASLGERHGALAGFERALALRPAWADVHFDRGFLLQELAEHRDAVAAFDAALAHRPDHDRALYGKALSLIALARRDEAVAPLEENTRLQPLSPYGWYQLGRLQFERGRPEKTRAIVAHLATFEPRVAAQLARETGLPPPGG